MEAGELKLQWEVTTLTVLGMRTQHTTKMALGFVICHMCIKDNDIEPLHILKTYTESRLQTQTLCTLSNEVVKIRLTFLSEKKTVFQFKLVH